MTPTDPQAQSADLEPNQNNLDEPNHLNGKRDEEFGRDTPAVQPIRLKPNQIPPARPDEPLEAAPTPKPTSNALVPIEQPEAPSGFRVRLTGDAPPEDSAQDAAVLAYEYERRRADWWRRRRFGVLGLPIAALALWFVALWLRLLGQEGPAGLLFWLGLLILVGAVAFWGYSWFTLPRVMSFGRTYRRLVSVPLTRGGIAWCDAAVFAPNFPALRDSFFTLYTDSRNMGSRAQPNNAEDTERKKQTLNDLQTLIKPVLKAQPEVLPTPFISRERIGALERVELEPLGWNEVADLAFRSVPIGLQHLNTPLELQRLAHDVEHYTNLKADGPETSLVQVTDEPLPTPLHRQIANRVSENFSLVGTEVDRWRERTTKEKAFHGGLLARYKEAEDQISLGYDRTALKLEEEIAPPTSQLIADVAFYQEQIEGFYQSQREVIETRRDTALNKLERERQELEIGLDERSDEQAMSQAEFKSLNEQRLRLETSTDSRFSSLKSQLSELLRRTYTLPPVPIFRSDYPEDPSVATANECMQQLAELRAETRLSTSALNNALNRVARLRFEPLDELARLETQIAGSNKWQATSYLGNLLNFKQSGQLLALAGEVSEAAGVYLDAVGDFERLNRRWCGLEAAIRELGLTAYASRLQEAQEYLLSLSQVAGSLHSSLMSSTHSPEMARPTTFQNIYDQAVGLQRELEELGALAGSITRLEERLAELNHELAQLQDYLARNAEETERVKTDASVRLYELSQKQKLMLEKLEEFKTNRVKRMREHIEELAKEKETTVKVLRTGASELGEVANTADKILRKHIGRSDRLIDEARLLHRGLETTLASIVRDFEQAVIPDRYVPIPSELFVPIWFFQFKERPLWRQRILGYASCYTAMERVVIPTTEPETQTLQERTSLRRFLLSTRPAIFYSLREDTHLAGLVGANALDYPAGAVQTQTEWIEKLAAEGWLSPWLVKMMKIAFR